MREMVGGCCVCSDDRGWSENPLVYCDGQSCTVAVHQACYGIVTVPTGPWYCRKCESQERSVKVKCELCPSRYGALKRTDNSGWAHVVCALYIPEVRFGNVTTMEPIQLQLIPTERFNKVCYICEEKGKAANATVGACMQCNKAGCRQQFHVTCAQSLGLLCEEAGNYLDNVKYCGYCEHHYSKLKKGGNVKTIPPYKPVSSENHLSDSNSEKEIETGGSGGPSSKPSVSQQLSTSASPTISTSASSSSTKRKTSSSGNRTSSSSSKSSSNSKVPAASSSSSHQKTVHSLSNKPDKIKTSSSSGSVSGTGSNSGGNNNNNNGNSVRSAKGEDTLTNNISETDTKIDIKDSDKSEVKEKSSKKRRNNSRTPTPVSNESATPAIESVSTTPEKKSNANDIEKPKKVKVETTQSILTNQPIVALTSISTIKSVTLPTTVTDSTTTETISTQSPPSTSTSSSIIQQSTSQQISQTVNSLVVSVPLSSTNLSPHHQLLNNQASVVTPTPFHLSERKSSDRNTPNNIAMASSSNQVNLPSSLDSNVSDLKITYEKQDAVTTEVDMELEVSQPETKRISEKSEKGSRGKKRNSHTNGIISQLSNTSISNPTTKRTHRGQQSTSSSPQPGAFAAISQSQLKDSPPSSPSSESQSSVTQASSSCSRSRGRSKKTILQSSLGPEPSSPRDTKDVKLFQNGATAPHMLGNQLNPNSNMAQKMSDHLNSELEAHSIFNPNDNSNVIGPQLHHRVIASARASTSGCTTSGGAGLSSMLGGSGGNIPQTLDQLLERQWEQGSQFLMEQAQHFDIASLLSCLHQLRAENLRLEEHVSSLLQRRDHLLAVNARLAIPLTGQPATPQPSHPHIVNNIHPAVGVSHAEVPRPSRHNNGNAVYPVHPQSTSQHSNAVPVENGLPPDPSSYSHRSPVVSQPQPSPSIRHSPAGSGYPNSNLLRQNADTSGRAAPRPQPYPLYQGSGPSQQQMVIRRDSDTHNSSSNPS